MMNTRCLEEGTHKIKPDLDSYREKDDNRFEMNKFYYSFNFIVNIM